MRYVDVEELETVAKYLVYLVANLPKIDPIKHGRWVKQYQGEYKCSECGDWWGTDDEEEIRAFRFCPNCGARMDEGKEKK